MKPVFWVKIPSNRACSRVRRHQNGQLVADNDGIGEQAMRLDAAPQCAFGGDQHGVGIDFQRRDPKRVEVRVPSPVIGELLVGGSGYSARRSITWRASARSRM
jgi:hypothetical protein